MKVPGPRGRRTVGVVAAASTVLAGMALFGAPAQAAGFRNAAAVSGKHDNGKKDTSLTEEGVQGPSFSGATVSPTGDKPQSKLWYTDGIWWADMFDSVSRTWHIFRLDREAQKWKDTGTRIDSRPNVGGDVLWDGKYLYVATNVVAVSSAVNKTKNPAKLFRFSYTSKTKTWKLDKGFPTSINDVSSESLTIDKDSTGTVWATWTQKGSVYVNSTAKGDSNWGKPFVLPGSGATGLSSDDISTLSVYGTKDAKSNGNNKVAVLWSDQNRGSFQVATHRAGESRTTWTTQKPLTGTKIADDHINLKRDGSGTLYAAVKSGRESMGNSASQNYVLSLNPKTGTWKKVTFGTVADCHTRPVLAIDLFSRRVHVLATAPSVSGCVHTGTPGSVYMKSASLDSLNFPSGRGDLVMRDPRSPQINDPTTTKQNVTPDSGIVILASDIKTKRYWHTDISLNDDED
jgi:hypothetical protein